MIWHCMILERTSCGGILLIQLFVIVFAISNAHCFPESNWRGYVDPPALAGKLIMFCPTPFPVFWTCVHSCVKRGFLQDLAYSCQIIQMPLLHSFSVYGKTILKLNVFVLLPPKKCIHSLVWIGWFQLTWFILRVVAHRCHHKWLFYNLDALLTLHVLFCPVHDMARISSISQAFRIEKHLIWEVVKESEIKGLKRWSIHLRCCKKNALIWIPRDFHSSHSGIILFPWVESVPSWSVIIAFI